MQICKKQSQWLHEKNNGQYIPAPVKPDVELPPELLELSEMIAKNVHEVWAQNRMAEGWTYGPVRDDAKRQTPCLVPYEDLPESEKDYDRNTAMETLKFIVTMGFDIVKKDKTIPSASASVAGSTSSSG